jgi:hypothetical protein
MGCTASAKPVASVAVVINLRRVIGFIVSLSFL